MYQFAAVTSYYSILRECNDVTNDEIVQILTQYKYLDYPKWDYVEDGWFLAFKSETKSSRNILEFEEFFGKKITQ